MVLMKRAAATTDLAGARRLLSSRLSQLDAAAAAAADETKPSQPKSALHLPAARRSDQRSTISIAGSSSRSSGSRSALLRSGADRSPRAPGAATTTTTGKHAPKVARQHLQLGRTKRSCSIGIGGAGSRGGFCRRHHLGANSDTSNSAGEASPSLIAAATAPLEDAPGRASRLTSSTRLGKTVSISASQDPNISTRWGLSGDGSRRLIIKLKPLPHSGHMYGAHNHAVSGKERKADTALLPHQIREQRIFNECRFVPIDLFYKKVLVAPNQDRQFFAAPKSIRGPGSRMLYDLANQNARHHQDVNLDFTRVAIERVCPQFCRPSQFRHIY